ncbi:hypothetical protein FAZ69_06465 [Trinickia terrae]|uniref:Carboxypeptidase regulatory-like domain-containing protein n=1 Tax=Trinickia terrae TaxID=2571161 RepID=A0A4U1IBR3_9BURK|nr:hypothetical protein [Trinickia terrae]TKC91008.1 hypothetical protein FAZ69_06465 [Trinickia terrae]
MKIRAVNKYLIGGTAMLMFAASAGFAAGVDSEPKDPLMFASGGMGKDSDSAYLRQARYHYNVHLTFVNKNGAYQSGVHVRLVNAKGEVIVDAISKGPLFYVRPPYSLPSSHYKLIVSKDGKSRQYDIDVGDKLVSLRIAL